MSSPADQTCVAADRALARRLERAEAASNAEFVDAHARVRPECGGQWIDVAGAYAMFDGAASPVTQTFGLGLFEPVTHRELETLERFFGERGADVHHEICPLADASLLPLLNQRGYEVVEFSNVLCRPIQPGLRLASARGVSLQVRRIESGEEALWAATSARGWQDVAPALQDFMLELGPINARRPDTCCFLAERADGADPEAPAGKVAEPIAAGALSLFEGVALLAGACTVPAWRKQGAQLALLEHRLRYGAEQGCDVAMIVTLPGSASQRNAERQGFRVAYTRTKWRLPSPRV